jgi:hypothetical protein
MKLFLDDERSVPNNTWHRAYNADEAIKFLDQYGPYMTHISLDHDLGTKLSGYDVICYMEGLEQSGRLSPDVQVTIHSANPPGAMRMAKVCEKMFGHPWTHYMVDYMALCREQENQ